MATVVDHIVSLIEGGHPTDRANLAAAHRRCNHDKENTRRKQRSLNASRDW
jgi:5-methylcytosine-specific restriction endonuclease McrA